MATDLTMKAKYPGSWRIDHQDIGEVCKTTFGTGVITEFQKLQDDPMQMGLLKVQVEGVGESDFLLPFYCPKKGYWDTTDHLSQDFNEADKYYYNAGMSFRPGDEVVVMLQEGAPVAVLGFKDGIPRVGEDIIKIRGVDFASSVWVYLCQCSKEGAQYGDINPSAEVGPDGAPLALEEVPIACDTVIGNYDVYTPDYSTMPPGQIYNDTLHCKYREWIVPIGPIMYLVTLLSSWYEIHPWYAGGWAVYAKPYTKDDYDAAMALAATKAATINPLTSEGSTDPNLTTAYPGFIPQPIETPWAHGFTFHLNENNQYLYSRPDIDPAYHSDARYTTLFAKPHNIGG